MTSKLTLRRLEARESGKYWRKAYCSGHSLGITLLLPLSAGLILFCFMIVDTKTLYGSSGTEDFVLQKGLEPESLFSHESEERIEMRVTPRTAVNVEWGNGDSSDVQVDDSSKVMESMENFEPAADGTNSAEVGESHFSSSYNNEYLLSKPEDSEQPQSDVIVTTDGAATNGTVHRSLVGCDIYHGRWVYDDTYPLYRSRNCPFVDRSFRCEENGRPDTDFMKYRWQPDDCDLPRFDPKEMLNRLRNQRLVFVGDSLGRNQWESMLCMLAEGVQNKSRIYEVNGQPISKHIGELLFRFEDYNCTVEYYRDTFLVPQTRPPPDLPENVTSVLKIDHVSWSAGSWPGANVMIFNTGHWWSWEKIGRPGGRFYMEQKLTTHSNEDAFKIGMKTWASWMERNLHPTTTQVFFRSFAPVHFRGGSWNKAGHCHEEVKPFTDEEVQQLQQVPWTNKLIVEAIDQNIKTKRSAVEYVDITTSTNYRSDGHPGLYGNDVKVNGFPPKNRQDCSHFCLPGVPDTWNELLYAALLARGQGVWGKFV